MTLGWLWRLEELNPPVSGLSRPRSATLGCPSRQLMRKMHHAGQENGVFCTAAVVKYGDDQYRVAWNVSAKVCVEKLTPTSDRRALCGRELGQVGRGHAQVSPRPRGSHSCRQRRWHVTLDLLSCLVVCCVKVSDGWLPCRWRGVVPLHLSRSSRHSRRLQTTPRS